MKKNKIISIGSLDSINFEILSKSILTLFKKKIIFFVVGDRLEIKKNFSLYNLDKLINNINNISEYETKKINIIDSNNYKKKYSNELLNDISIAYNLAIETNSDLITMPINKYEIKKKNNFNGITEFLAKISKTKTYMLMKGDFFSIIPLTTHIPINKVSNNFINELIDVDRLFNFLIKNNFLYKNIIFLGINPHAGENGTIGHEDELLRSKIKKLKGKFKNFNFKGPVSADSAFKNVKNDSLFISAFHDQALIPFKLLNKKQINFTIGLKVRRFSPAHGTARDIKNKNKAQIESFLECMKI